jgi:hypothetical protein
MKVGKVHSRSSDDVPLRYRGRGALSLRGPNTARVYYFAAVGFVVTVHRDDVDALLTCPPFPVQRL